MIENALEIILLGKLQIVFLILDNHFQSVFTGILSSKTCFRF